MKFKGLILVCCLFLLMVCFSGCKKSSEAGTTTEETTVEESTAEETMTETTDTTAEEAPAEEVTEEAPVE